MRNKAVLSVSGALLRVRGNPPRAGPSPAALSSTGCTETSSSHRGAVTGNCVSMAHSAAMGDCSLHHFADRCLPALCGGRLRLSASPLALCTPCTPCFTHTRAASDSVSPACLNKHLDLTARQTRADCVASGEVVRVWQQSNWVKCFDVKVEHPDFRFKAGQWVDTFIPGVEVVGGFSLCTAPHQLEETRTITLGIKRAEWPPAKWFFEQCRVGSVVELRVGGDFFLDYPSDEEQKAVPSPVLLVGGGVGINPLAAMFRHAAHHSGRRGRVALLYSARTEQDLLYKDELDSLCHEGRELRVDFFTTREQASAPGDNIHSGRITEATIAKALSRLCSYNSPSETVTNITSTSHSNHTTNTGSNTEAPHGDGESDANRTSGISEGSTPAGSSTSYVNYDRSKAVLDTSALQVFVCGPPAMIRAVEEHLLHLGLRQPQIRYEKWW